MKNQITIREATAENEVAAFWEELCSYFRRDILPGRENDEWEYFLGEEYRSNIQKIHERPQDRCYYLFFCRDGQDIGFAMPVIFTTEDGKCFIMEFCVYPEYRGGGTGKECAKALLDWAKEHGAFYAELNYSGDPRREHFWESIGFVKNGADEWGDPLMILPPEETVPFSVEILSNPEDWQLKKLENGFLEEIGENPFTEEQQDELARAIRDGKITFFLAKRGYRAVGICSVARYFSTFGCSESAVFEDFYIEPVFRKKGIAKKLLKAVQEWCTENGIKSLTVCCSPCDEEMYQGLGFDIPIGRTYSHIFR